MEQLEHVQSNYQPKCGGKYSCHSRFFGIGQSWVRICGHRRGLASSLARCQRTPTTKRDQVPLRDQEPGGSYPQLGSEDWYLQVNLPPLIYTTFANPPSDAGIYDCGFYPGSYGYEELDAGTYASWGIDYLKYDNCGGFQANTLSPQERFTIMGNALKNTGREIFYSLCQWGNQFPWFWADQFSDSYRMSGDITSSFASDNSGVCKTAYCLNTGYAGVSVLTMIRKMRELSGFQAPGSWGMYGRFFETMKLTMV